MISLFWLHNPARMKTISVVNMGALILRIQDDLESHVEESYRRSFQDRFGINATVYFGVRTPVVREIADRYYREILSMIPTDRLRRCVDLLETGIYEMRILAFRWANRTVRDLSALDVEIPVSWIDRYVTDWSDCDDLCMQVIGTLFLRFPAQAFQVLDWCSSPNRWKRRAASVALIRAGRQGLQLGLIFEVSRALAADSDDLVRKAHGWLLRETSRKRPDEVFQHLLDHRHMLPRAVVTMASRKFTPDRQDQLRGTFDAVR